jgi:hypothetical protein
MVAEEVTEAVMEGAGVATEGFASIRLHFDLPPPAFFRFIPV